MDLNPFNAIGNFVLGLIKNGQMQAWCRLFVSIFGTAFVSFFGIMGITIGATYPEIGAMGSLVLGFAAGCLAMATSVLFLWRRSSLTKGIPIVAPGDVDAALTRDLQKQTMVLSGEKEKK